MIDDSSAPVNRQRFINPKSAFRNSPFVFRNPLCAFRSSLSLQF
jgi:hypothetical protein